MRLICFTLFCASLMAADSSRQRLEAVVDWAEGKVYLKIEQDLKASEATRSNAQLRADLRVTLVQKMSVIAANLYGKVNDERSAELAEFWAGLKVQTFQVAANTASATMFVPLRGAESLIAALPLNFATSKHEDGEYENAPAEPLKYTGLIIDARHLPFEPTLAPNIFTASGRLIYGMAYLNRSTGVKRGVVGFVGHESAAEVRRRAGTRPMKVSALELAADGGLIVSDEDAAKLTAHAESLKSLRRARVVILVAADKLKQVF